MQRPTNEDFDAHCDGTAAAPLVIDASGPAARASLVIGALLALVKVDAAGAFRALLHLSKGRVAFEEHLVAAGAGRGLPLPLEPELIAFAAHTADSGRAVHVVGVDGSPLLRDAVAHQSAIAGLSTAPVDGIADHVVRRDGGLDVERRMAGNAAAAPRVMARLPRPSPVREIVRSLRLHQCVKNLIVFVPVMLGGRLTDLIEVRDTLMAFLALTLVAAGTYLVNDVWDAADDRKHWSKRERSIASGRLPVATALAAALPIIGLGLLLGALVSAQTGAMLGIYLLVTLAYTLRLKTVPFLDGLVLASLFTIRLGVGAVAADVPPSPWLFVFSMFVFSSLGYAKRYTELARAIERRDRAISGRGYRTSDALMVMTVGLASGIGAVLIMVLYIVEEAFRSSFYGATGWLWGFPPLMFLFLMRLWLVSTRGEMNDDPVAFAIKDRACLALLGLLSVCFAFAWLG